MNKLTPFLSHLTIGPPQTHGNLKVYPLHRQNGHERQYRTLDEAMQEEVIDVTEVSEGGSVPSLKVKNTGKLPVLLIIGEENELKKQLGRVDTARWRCLVLFLFPLSHAGN